MNPLEIREAKLFAVDDIPRDLAFGQEDMLAAVRRPDATVLE
jgi:hypothetical protein